MTGLAMTSPNSATQSVHTQWSAEEIEFQKGEQSLRKLRSTFGLAVGVVMMPMGAAMDATFYPESIR